MRPLRIEMVGFGAFREPTEVVLDDLDLVAFCGPTGAGKSTIIDAVTFALYGSIARYDNQGAVAPVVHTLANGAKVRLDFELSGQAYTAVREVRRTANGASTREARLQRGDEVLVDGAREMTPAVVELLGLDFDQFTRTVVLPQGDFADLLHDTPTERQKLLRRLLDLGVYERIGQRARARAAAADHQATVHREQIATHEAAGITRARQAELVTRADALEHLHAEAGEQVAALAELDAHLSEQQQRMAALAEQRARLLAVVVPPAVADLAGGLAEARQAVAAADAELQAARAERDRARTERADGPEPGALERLLADHQAEADRAAVLAQTEAERAALTAETEAAEATQAAADAELADAAAVLDAARLAASAADYVAHLVVGQPCPVCRQPVATLPDHDSEGELAAATAAEAAARAAADAARRAADKVRQRRDRAAAKAEALADGLAELRSRLEASPGPDAVAAQLEQARRLVAAADAAEQAADRVEALAGEAATALARLQQQEQALRRSFGTARDTVAPLGPPEPGGDDLRADWDELAAWAAGEADRLAGEAEQATKAVEAAGHERARIVDAIGEAAAAAGVALEGVEAHRLGEHLATLATAARHEQRHHQEQLAALDGQRQVLAGLEEERQVASELGGLMRANRFEAWLLEGALDDLLDGASERLRALSNGQFSLVRDGTDLRVRDHRNADELRSVKTLSGGETFLASLALALALAERISSLAHAGAPRIEAMFLDEGFGTLDPETLDVVAAALEELGAAGHMVGVVTHIRDLADRLPVRIEVRKGTTTSTVERVTA